MAHNMMLILHFLNILIVYPIFVILMLTVLRILSIFIARTILRSSSAKDLNFTDSELVIELIACFSYWACNLYICVHSFMDFLIQTQDVKTKPTGFV